MREFDFAFLDELEGREGRLVSDSGNRGPSTRLITTHKAISKDSGWKSGFLSNKPTKAPTPTSNVVKEPTAHKPVDKETKPAPNVVAKSSESSTKVRALSASVVEKNVVPVDPLPMKLRGKTNATFQRKSDQKIGS